MLKPVKKCGVVESIKGCGHIESRKNSDFARVYSFQDVICKFEQSSLGRVEFAVSRLKRTETGRDRYMREEACKSKSFQNFANCVKIRDRSEIGRIRF